MEQIFRRQAVGFKINGSYGCVLRHKQNARLRYFHASFNNFSLCEAAKLITDHDDLQSFIANNLDVATLAERSSIEPMPNTEWRWIALTNVAIHVYHMLNQPIGGPPAKRALETTADDDDDDDDDDPDTRLSYKSVSKIPRLGDNLCFFKALALHIGAATRVERSQRPAKALFDAWRTRAGKSTREFQGVILEDLTDLESFFGLEIFVNTLKSINEATTVAKLLRRPVKRDHASHPPMRLHLTSDQRHFHYIRNMTLYSRNFACKKMINDIDSADGVYEVSMNPSTIKLDLPIQIPFFVYQYAKLRMLRLKYEVLDRYLDPRVWSCLYTDTDSLYFDAAYDDFRDLV
jgi:hypothetical protein